MSQILERRVYYRKNPVLSSGEKYTFYKLASGGYQVYTRQDRGPGMSDEYKEYHSELPEHLQWKWEQGTPIS